jgi:two-component system, chemotaxis family, sensor kinase CheA
MGEFDAAIAEFLIESDENLSQVEADLVDLEGHPGQEDIIASIFRAIHTVKGTCSFLGYKKLEKVAHTGETLLSMVRDGDLPLSPDITTALLAMVDAIRQMLTSIEGAGNDGDQEFTELIARLTALQTGSPAGSSPAGPAEPAVSTEEFPKNGNLDSVVSEEPAPAIEELAPVALAEPHEDMLHDSHADLDHHAVGAEASAANPAHPADAPKGAGVTDSTIRVDVKLLDKLMNMVGELVLTRNQILQWTSGQEDQGIAASSQRLSLITSELQEGIMKTRMQPIGNIFSKFPRVVRDLALTCGKEVRIEMEGQDTELDKTLLEAIKDPLTHLVRNSVDHGLEKPEVRQAKGKSVEGRLLLRAYHEGGQVNIEITDDGAGINSERVVQSAIKKGAITAEQVSRMSERELQNLIFLPGLSTAEKVTNVSGRGVGMDVVKTNIEKIGGTVDLHTKVGKGTTIKVKVPLTLAIIPALVVTTGGERFAIPQVSLLELVRLEGEQIKKSIEDVHGAPVCRLRGSLLPIVYLDKILQLNSPTPAAHQVEETGEEVDIVNIVVLQADNQRFGLVVENINDTEEIVVKPLSKQLKGIPVFAGATIMGDGHVALILDVMNLAKKGGFMVGQGEHAVGDKTDQAKEVAKQRQTVLLIQIGSKGRLAVPLGMVARLEEIKASALEMAGDQEAIQYRNEILPVVRLSQVLGQASSVDEQDMLQLVVISKDNQRLGLVVDRIVDIVEEELVASTRSTQPGVFCSSVIHERITDVLDVSSVFQHSHLYPMDAQSLETVEV